LNRWGGCRPPPYPQAASVRCLSRSTFSAGRSMKDMIIGVDLAKCIFQVHGATPSEDVVYRKKLIREQFRAFLTILLPVSWPLRPAGAPVIVLGKFILLVTRPGSLPRSMFFPSSKGKRTMPLMVRRSSLPHTSRRCALSRLSPRSSKPARRSLGSGPIELALSA
jgi:hypothetical protein